MENVAISVTSISSMDATEIDDNNYLKIGIVRWK